MSVSYIFEKTHSNASGFFVDGIKQTGPKVIDEYNAINFWRKVAIKAQDKLCWEWQGSTNYRGYGMTTIKRRSTAASRRAYMLHNNVVLNDKKMLVCHTCDNPICCNPNHLFLGTTTDNARDMWVKGRGKGQFLTGREDTLKGSKNPSAKIKETDVIEIRRLKKEKGMLLKDIAKLFNISGTTTGRIVSYKLWKHVK